MLAVCWNKMNAIPNEYVCIAISFEELTERTVVSHYTQRSYVFRRFCAVTNLANWLESCCAYNFGCSLQHCDEINRFLTLMHDIYITFLNHKNHVQQLWYPRSTYRASVTFSTRQSTTAKIQWKQNGAVTCVGHLGAEAVHIPLVCIISTFQTRVSHIWESKMCKRFNYFVHSMHIVVLRISSVYFLSLKNRFLWTISIPLCNMIEFTAHINVQLRIDIPSQHIWGRMN